MELLIISLTTGHGLKGTVIVNIRVVFKLTLSKIVSSMVSMHAIHILV